jgi:hypothetical protein
MKTKTASDYTATIVVDQTPKEGFKAITNIAEWWSEEIEGDTHKLNDEFFYHYKDIHLCKMKLIELVPNQKVVWQVFDNYFKFTKDKSEWKGTKIVFDISQKGKKTEIKFTHQGLVPQYECYEICREAWTHYITESLRDLITTGKGQPNKKEENGFDAQFVSKWKLDREPGTVEDKKQKNGNAGGQDYTTSIVVDETPKEVFNAINNVRGWWQGEIEGSTDKLNDEFTYRMKDIHFSKQKVVELIPDKKVVWLVTESKLNFTKDKSEWTGTKIIFDISKQGSKTQLRFTHASLVPEFECYGGCSGAWGGLIEKSLFSLITTGKGKKVF